MWGMVSGPGQGQGGMYEADGVPTAKHVGVTREAGLREGQQLDSVERVNQWEG